MTPKLEIVQQRELLTPPIAFKRTVNKAFLFIPYSAILKRRVYLTTPAAYDLWVRIESDPRVTSFNERPPQVAVARDLLATPRFVSVNVDRVLTIHNYPISAPATVEGNEDVRLGQQPTDDEWASWCASRQYLYVNWSPATLRANPIELDSLKRFLRFACKVNPIRNLNLENTLIAELTNVRNMTVHALVNKFPAVDRQITLETICRLILVKRIFSDIDLEPFSLTTVLSAHHHGIKN